MSTRTIIEINHDYLGAETRYDMEALLKVLRASEITRRLNEAHERGEPFVYFGHGICIYAQRHHTEERTITFR